jgi:hypothetical protein
MIWHSNSSACRMVRLPAALLLISVFFPAAFGSAFAQEGGSPAGPIIAGVEFSSKQLLSMGYDANCPADPGTANALFCGLSGSYTGKDKAEWQASVTRSLADTKASLGRIEATLVNIVATEADLSKKLDKALQKIDDLPVTTTVGAALINIQAAYNDDFVPLFGTGSVPDWSRSVAFAKRMIFDEHIHDDLRRMHDPLTQSVGNTPSLLEGAYKEALVGLDPTKDDLTLPYSYVQTLLSRLLAVQRKGEIIYAWSAAILDTDCYATKKCEDLPYTRDEFDEMMSRHVQQQLDAFEMLTTQMVLSGALPHSRDPNFLPKTAASVFRAADLFTTAYQDDGVRLRGRVIALGDSYDGKIDIAGTKSTASFGKSVLGPKFVIKTPSLDWWLKRDGQPVYDELHFSDEWRVYTYAITDETIDTYKIVQPFPWTSGDGKVESVSFETGKPTNGNSDAGSSKPFDSFLVIARAGGSYALMEDAWDISLEQNVGSYPAYAQAPYSQRTPIKSTGDASHPILSINWADGWPWYPSHLFFRGDFAGQVSRKRPIVFPAGGTVNLQMTLGDGVAAACGCVYGPEMDGGVVTFVMTDFARPVLTTYSTGLRVRAGVSFGPDRTNGKNWNSLISAPGSKSGKLLHNAVETFPVTFPAGTPQKASVFIDGDYVVSTSGFLTTTQFSMLAALKIDDMFIGSGN